MCDICTWDLTHIPGQKRDLQHHKHPHTHTQPFHLVMTMLMISHYQCRVLTGCTSSSNSYSTPIIYFLGYEVDVYLLDIGTGGGGGFLKINSHDKKIMMGMYHYSLSISSACILSIPCCNRTCSIIFAFFYSMSNKTSVFSCSKLFHGFIYCQLIERNKEFFIRSLFPRKR